MECSVDFLLLHSFMQTFFACNAIANDARLPASLTHSDSATVKFIRIDWFSRNGI